MDRLDEWRTFIAVASRRSFVAAARALGRSPQAATRAVAALEGRLGTRLLHRTTRAVSLTGDGERILERARRALGEIDLLESALDAERPLAGRLSVTAPALFGQLHVAPVVNELLRDHPGLDVRLMLLDRVVSLAEEGIDVAVRIGALPDSSLRARPVSSVRSLVCASPAYLKRRGVPRSPDDLADHDCIAYLGATAIPDRWSFPSVGRRERSVAVHARLVVNTSQVAVEAAAAGLGIVRALSYQVAALVDGRKLKVVLEKFQPPPVPVQLLYPPGPQPRAATALMDLAAKRIAPRL